MKTVYAEYDSPMGKLFLACDGESLKELRFGPAPGQLETAPVLKQARLWLDDYFRGNFRAADFLIAPEGTVFQKQVWECLKQIPPGQTITYGDLARKLRPGMSARAVGQAVGKNPVAILIPCHRVVGAKGQLTGYAWGIEKKRRLLDWEEAIMRHS